jgi:hypothetical protein
MRVTLDVGEIWLAGDGDGSGVDLEERAHSNMVLSD